MPQPSALATASKRTHAIKQAFVRVVALQRHPARQNNAGMLERIAASLRNADGARALDIDADGALGRKRR